MSRQTVPPDAIELPVGLPEPEQPISKKITLHNLDEYIDAVSQYKARIIMLAQQGAMSEAVAERVIAESEYSFYVQLVKVTYE